MSGQAPAGEVVLLAGVTLADARWPVLLHRLRQFARETAVKEGCGVGHCGACTVLVSGRPRLACLTLSIDAPAEEVVTAAQIFDTPLGQRLAASFNEYGALQCGYCTPGMVTLAFWILSSGEIELTRSCVRAALAGNICRCTGYQQIIDAVLAAGGALAHD